jgi:hypothetical protein
VAVPLRQKREEHQEDTAGVRDELYLLLSSADPGGWGCGGVPGTLAGCHQHCCTYTGTCSCAYNCTWQLCPYCCSSGAGAVGCDGAWGQ